MADKIMKNSYWAKRYAINHFRYLTGNKRVSARAMLKTVSTKCRCGETRAEVYIILSSDSIFKRLNDENKAVIKIGICDVCGEKI